MPRMNDAPPGWEETSIALRRFAIALTGSEHDAQDLCQQAMLQILSSAPEKLTHVGYARRVLTNLWIDRKRRLGARMRRWMTVACTTPVHHVDEDDEARRETLVETRRAIDRLPPMQRAVLVLRVVEDLPFARIASELDITEQNARAHMHLARRRLRQEVTP